MSDPHERNRPGAEAGFALDTEASRREHARACEIFDAVRAAPAQNRAVLLDSHCGSDARLRAEVESLLRAHDGASGFLERGALTGEPVGRDIPLSPLVPGYLGEALAASGEVEVAAEVLTTAVADLRRAYGDDSPAVKRAALRCASVLHQVGRAEEAAALRQELDLD